MKFGDKDVTLKLGDKDVTIKLGKISVFTPDREPSSGVPIDSSFAVMIGGTWHQYNLNPEDHTTNQGQLWADDIVAILGNDNLDSYDVEELSIGCESFVNIDGSSFPNCTGLTLSPCVTGTSDIHNFESIGWVYVMGQELFVEVGEDGFRLFQNMNCCPIYVPEASLSDYQSAWENETTDDCGGTVADRLRVWGDYPEPCNSPKVSLYSGGCDYDCDNCETRDINFDWEDPDSDNNQLRPICSLIYDANESYTSTDMLLDDENEEIDYKVNMQDGTITLVDDNGSGSEIATYYFTTDGTDNGDGTYTINISDLGYGCVVYANYADEDYTGGLYGCFAPEDEENSNELEE